MTAAKAPAKKESSAERVKREQEWSEVVESLPELLSPLAISDETQLEFMELSQQFSAERRKNSEFMPTLKDLARVVPKVFVDADEFEEWRQTISVTRRLPTYMKIFSHYLLALGESEGSTP